MNNLEDNKIISADFSKNEDQTAELTEEQVQQVYNSLNAADPTNSLEKLAAAIKMGENLDYVDFALIVYESPTNPCSERVILQQWLHDNGIECEEWKN